MKLKEAFRMQNHLSILAEEAADFIRERENVVTTIEQHQRSKGNPAAADEEVEVKRQTEMEPNKVIDLYMDLIAEKEKLALEIGKAKAQADIDMDAAIASNKSKQEAMNDLKLLSRIAASETKFNGRDYLINSEGNQMPYVYPVVSVSTIDFDRNAVKGMLRRLQRETDEVSAKIDLLNVSLEVAYTPKYEIGESFEDVYEKIR